MVFFWINENFFDLKFSVPWNWQICIFPMKLISYVLIEALFWFKMCTKTFFNSGSRSKKWKIIKIRYFKWTAGHDFCRHPLRVPYRNNNISVSRNFFPSRVVSKKLLVLLFLNSFKNVYFNYTSISSLHSDSVSRSEVEIALRRTLVIIGTEPALKSDGPVEKVDRQLVENEGTGESVVFVKEQQMDIDMVR